ncbi:hypothetical protein ASPWEDRAFT_43847 [Aspergillus wentii DTO 134E9]|uniref:Yeast cell wall synthesis Kre9/Knh1-like N-terminal domain-containing protein n=1 Tax=Aspergillus wentii DTO 134E9 TaxID=1073089 RepID=A0A1L9RAG8_ASPWE|nr:uncharacterized protein ASPWEDRAFT_43847 [Aspergillus wentii DTO 134E9]KAI9934436.1 hypothetical protein MW887_000050 [Aspergillus wentii]OJJ31847.1 hypothetical protein ASPWEDRAFT_43847 [Aspergillus wentii DTO 134E9]
MRSAIYMSLSAFAAVVAAASSNPFNNPAGGYSFKAGSPTTITWDPTTSGTVSLKLQWGNALTPDSGSEIASEIDNSGSYSWTPESSLADRDDYTVEIISDDDSSEVNYLPRFSVSGVTGSASTTEAASTTTGTASSSTTSDATTTDATTTTGATTGTTTGTASTTLTTQTSTSTDSTTSGSSSSPSPTSSGSSTASSSAAATTSGASSTSDASSTTDASSTSSPSASASTVPDTNSGMINRVSGGMMAIVLGAAFFL